MARASIEVMWKLPQLTPPESAHIGFYFQIYHSMSFFTKSYLTSEQLELSRIAASSSPSGPLDSSQQQSTSLLRSTRNIPPELRAPPYNPQQELQQVQEEDVELEDPFNQGNKGQSQGEPTQVEDLFTEHPTTSSTLPMTDTESQEKERKRARTSQIGKMLFPPCRSFPANFPFIRSQTDDRTFEL